MARDVLVLARNGGKQVINLPFLAFVAFLGGVVFLMLSIADWERKASVESLSEYKISRSALDADPALKPLSAKSPYMRSER